MKHKLSFILLFLTLYTFSQKEANFWYFGRNAGIDFTNGAPTALTNGQLNTSEGCSTISDADGNLLFYSDGTTLYNANHQIMPFDDGFPASNLGGNPSSTQSALFVPNPTDTNIYYLFTVGTDFVGRNGPVANPGFKYYTIDKSKNNGLGAITAGPVNLAINPNNNSDLSNGWSEKVTAVQGDCNSIWILSTYNNIFYAYKITETGVSTSPVISNTDYFLRDKRGYLKVSPDGKKVALADFNGSTENTGSGSLVLYDFDVNTGLVSNSNILTSAFRDGDPYGVEFNQLSNKLYASNYINDSNNIFQFDLTADNIASTKRLITNQPGFRSGLQLGPDGKIYVSIPGKTALDAIENPNDAADAIIYKTNAVSLGTNQTAQGLPPFIQSFFSPINIVDSNDPTLVLSNSKQRVCSDVTITMEPEITGNNASTYIWTKEGDASFLVKERVLEVNTANYGSGIYNLEMIVEDDCGIEKRFNSSIDLEFVEPPKLNSIPVYEQCDFDNNTLDFTTNFNLSIKESELYTGSRAVTIDFFEADDVTFSNPLPKDNYINSIATTTNNHTIIARAVLTDINCYQTVPVSLKVNPSGISNYPNTYTTETDVNLNTPNSTFSSGSGNASYNFDTKTAEIIANSNGALSTATHTFQYFKSKEDARLLNNEILEPFENTVFNTNDTIFVKISLKNTGACESIGQFNIIVNPLPIPKGNPDVVQLCLSNPILNPQTITVNLDADTGTTTDRYKWYLNGLEIAGETSAIHKANTKGTYKVEAFRDYENDTSTNLDNSVTTGFNTFTVNESNIAAIESITFKDNQDKLEENFITITVSGIGVYEYALNSNNPLDFKKGDTNLTYTFTDVKPGLNTIYIKDTNGCGIINTKEISFVFFQRFFTPNGDGRFDTWQIQGIDNAFYKSAKLDVFDRFGKFIISIDLKNNSGWNGTFNGTLMPQNDYWYNAVLIDINDNVRTQTGHFSLLRR